MMKAVAATPIVLAAQIQRSNNPNGWVGAGSEITAGSKRVGSLTCGNSYYFQVSGKGNGSANGFANSYGPWSDQVQGSTSGCLSPPPAPDNVRASVDLPNARVTVTWDEVDGVDPNNPYKLERGHSDLGASTTVGWPDPTNSEHADRIITDMFETNNGIVSRTINLAALGLPCGPDVLYSFRVSAYGNGTNHLEEYGPAREATFGALTTSRGTSTGRSTARAPTQSPLCTPALRAPVLDVIPLPQRRAQLRWDEVTDAASYEIEIWDTQANAGAGDWVDYPGYTSGTSVVITLDSIHRGRGLAHQPSGFKFRVKAIAANGSSIPDSEYAEFTIVDSPIRSVNGDSREGKMKIRWNTAGSGAQYTVRWRKISNKDTNSHTNENWRPVEWRSSHAGSEYDWDSETTSSSRGYDIDNEDQGIDEGEIYAVQVNYTVGNHQYFSARERYAWISNRRGGYRLDGDERIGNFPLGFPLNDPLAPNNKTYAYRICADTFASDETKQNEWIALIEHALEQWELASDGLVMMDHALDENGNRAPCVNYAGVMNAVLAQVGSILAEQIEMGEEEMVNLSDLREFFFNLNITGFSSEEDKKRNEIIMVDLDLQRLTEFKGDELWEFSDYLSLSGCIFEGEACAQTDATGVRILGIDIIVPIVIESSTTDILIRSDRRSNNLSIPSVSFNMCSGPNIEVYEDLVHEAGHALGISDGEFFQSERLKDYIENHPPLVDSVMNYNKVIDSLLLTAPGIEKKDFDEPDCSPHPMDIMAIYVLYQTVD